MYLFKTRGPNGREHPRWRFQYTDWRGCRRTGAGDTSKSETEKLAAHVQAEQDAIRKGWKPAPKTSDKPRALVDVVQEYRSWGKTQGGRGGRPWSPSHERNKARHLDHWLAELGPIAIGDVTLARAEAVLRELARAGLPGKGPDSRVFCSASCRSRGSWLRRRGKALRSGDGCAVCGASTPKRRRRNRPLSGRSLQTYAEAIRGLTAWARRRGFIEVDPLQYMAGFDATPRTHRRAPTDSEIRAILEHTATPAERLLYEVALCTGYRLGELRALRVSDLDAAGCTLPLAAEFCKGRKDSRQPIPAALVGLLAASCAGRPAEAPLLEALQTKNGPLSALYATMARAGVSRFAPGGRLDFHSLRVGYVSRVIECGASVKEAQTLARHSTPNLTLNVYARASGDRLRAVAEAVGAGVLSLAGNTTEAQRKAAGAESLILPLDAWCPGRDSNPHDLAITGF